MRAASGQGRPQGRQLQLAMLPASAQPALAAGKLKYNCQGQLPCQFQFAFSRTSPQGANRPMTSQGSSLTARAGPLPAHHPIVHTAAWGVSEPCQQSCRTTASANRPASASRGLRTCSLQLGAAALASHLRCQVSRAAPSCSLIRGHSSWAPPRRRRGCRRHRSCSLSRARVVSSTAPAQAPGNHLLGPCWLLPHLQPAVNGSGCHASAPWTGRPRRSTQLQLPRQQASRRSRASSRRKLQLAPSAMEASRKS